LNNLRIFNTQPPLKHSMTIVRNLTPEAAKCPPPACPNISLLDNGSYLVIGKTIKLPPELASMVGKDEVALLLPPTFQAAFAK
jgi:hypothetical protein